MLKSKKNKLIIFGVLFLSCVLCSVCSVIYSMTPAGRAASTSNAATLTAKPTKTVRPTITSRPSRTPEPTEPPTITPLPTETFTPLPPTEPPTPTFTPPPTGFDLLLYSDETRHGESALLQIHTQPGATCNLSMTLPSGRASDADGLGQRIANELGICSWWWELRGNITPGTATLTISAGGQTTSVSMIISD